MHIKQTALTLLALTLATGIIRAAAPEENVVIPAASEEYRFIHGKNGVEVKHSITLEYKATRRAEKIQPHIFHSNIVRLDKASGGKAEYRNANSPTVFHDDSKVCFFDIYLYRKDSKAKVQFKRTFTDGAHFTGLFPAEEYPVLSKTITFHIPASLPGISLSELNFPAQGISRDEKAASDGARTIIYTIKDLPEMPDDDGQPPLMSSLAGIMVKGYFPDCDSLYRYHRPMLDVDTAISGVNELVAKLTAGTEDRDEKISRLYRHVQKNIRYVAFEEGEAAYRPDSPAEVLRKRYGDCKGMSLLLATLLNRAGIEARIACVGTDKIPFRIAEAPSLSATNHMICIVPDGRGYLFLDPTHEQISARHIPEWICGKDAMMFTPGGYTMIDIPQTSPLRSEDRIDYKYVLTEAGLIGSVERRCTEDMAEGFMRSYSEVPGQHLKELLVKALIPSQRASIRTDSVKYSLDTPGEVLVTAPILNPASMTVVDNAIYLDLNTNGDPFTKRIDTDRRKADYEFGMKGRVVRRTSVKLLGDGKITLPDNYREETPQATFSCTFSREGNSISMTKTLELHKRRLALADIPAWNKSVAAWNEACNQQVELRAN